MSAIRAGSAWMKKILRLTVTAPKMPAMITQVRKKILMWKPS